MAKFLLLCPTYDHADTLFASIASVRAQEFGDWEMVVIGDGAPARTKQVVDAIMTEDKRIRAFWHPKSERFGEIYRDPVIRESNVEFVCHLSDDDIWLPDHLTRMLELLERAEWANQAPLRLLPKGGVEWWPINCGTSEMRQASARGVQVGAGINYVGYRRDAYLRLPEGWTCAPRIAGASDVYMWAKFFRNPALKVASSSVSSAIKFPSHARERLNRTPEQRMAEITPWLARAAKPGMAQKLRRGASIRDRMIALFSIHGASACRTVDEALALAGFRAAPPEVVPKPALNGEPMLLPLTDEQRHEAFQAWALVRACAVDDSDAEEARSIVATEFRRFPGRWLEAVRCVAVAGDIEQSLRAAEYCRAVLDDQPQSHIILVEMLIRAGRARDSVECINTMKRRWPNNPQVARFESRQRQAHLP